ncbi:MAG: globin [Henriciella sp.]|jgi:hemoglobin-like flavoprotein
MNPMLTRSEAIDWTLATVADRIGDPAPLIYQRLFAERPDFEDLFVMDTDGGVRGSMLATSFDCLLGAAGNSDLPRLQLEAARMIHDGYGLRDDDIDLMFRVIRDVCRDTLGAAWTSEIDRHWQDLLTLLARLGRTPS